MPALGNSSRTAVARMCAEECRRTSSASGSRSVRIASVGIGLEGPVEVPDRAVHPGGQRRRASPGPIPSASLSRRWCRGGTSRTLPSGRVRRIVALIGAASHGVGDRHGTGVRRRTTKYRAMPRQQRWRAPDQPAAAARDRGPARRSSLMIGTCRFESESCACSKRVNLSASEFCVRFDPLLRVPDARDGSLQPDPHRAQSRGSLPHRGRLEPRRDRRRSAAGLVLGEWVGGRRIPSGPRRAAPAARRGPAGAQDHLGTRAASARRRSAPSRAWPAWVQVVALSRRASVELRGLGAQPGRAGAGRPDGVAAPGIDSVINSLLVHGEDDQSTAGSPAPTDQSA